MSSRNDDDDGDDVGVGGGSSSSSTDQILTRHFVGRVWLRCKLGLRKLKLILTNPKEFCQY